MNRKTKTDQHRENSSRYLNQTESGHIINPTSGLYEPCAAEEESEISQDRRVKITNNPLPISSDRDWKDIWDTVWSGANLLITVFGLLISVGTLVLLIYTVYYARLQWAEAKRTADASLYSAEATVSAANTASQTLGELKKGSQDTRNLVGAAVSQAESSKTLTNLAIANNYIVAQPKFVIKWLGVYREDHTPFIDMTITNDGGSPAFESEGFTHIEFRKIPPNTSITAFSGRVTKIGNGKPVPSLESVTPDPRFFGKEISAKDVETLKLSNSKIFIWGILKFTDSISRPTIVYFCKSAPAKDVLSRPSFAKGRIDGSPGHVYENPFEECPTPSHQ